MSSTTCPVHQVRVNIDDGYFRAKSMMSPTGFPVRALIKIFPKRVIPVIFLPGIMGTNLRIKIVRDAAWRPPNGAATGLIEVLRYLKKDARARMDLLHPDRVEVDDSGPVEVHWETEAQMIGVGNADIKTFADLHGWAELHQSSYSFILNRLHCNLHSILDDTGRPAPYWRKYVLNAQGQKEFGAEKEFKSVTSAEILRFSSAAYPLHAVGYNWLQSNEVSAKCVAERIEKIVGFYRDRLGRDCEKVILVTHSMGGLVARALTQLIGCNRVLGVLHGVMPAIGAPATYKRMRAGFEGVEQVLLGRDAAETTAILGQSPGPLELLPSAEYRLKNNERDRHWLRATFISPQITKPNVDSYLGVGDPYEKIYLNRNDWWRLVNAALLQPSAPQTPEQLNSSFRAFGLNLGKTRLFHERLAGNYHKNTYAFYAADLAHPSWGEVRWIGSGWGDKLDCAELVGDDRNGTISVKWKDRIQAMYIAAPNSPGDGTVPEVSGQAPKEFVRQIFRHEGKKSGHPSYEHQLAYGDDFIAGLTLYSIVRLTIDSKYLDSANEEFATSVSPLANV